MQTCGSIEFNLIITNLPPTPHPPYRAPSPTLARHSAAYSAEVVWLRRPGQRAGTRGEGISFSPRPFVGEGGAKRRERGRC